MVRSRHQLVDRLVVVSRLGDHAQGPGGPGLGTVDEGTVVVVAVVVVAVEGGAARAWGVVAGPGPVDGPQAQRVMAATATVTRCRVRDGGMATHLGGERAAGT